MLRNQSRLFRVWAICGPAGRFDFLSRKLSLIVFISAFWAMRRRVNVFDIWNSDSILIFAEHNEYNGWWKPENQNRLNFIEFKNRQCYKNEFLFGIEHFCLPCLLNKRFWAGTHIRAARPGPPIFSSQRYSPVGLKKSSPSPARNPDFPK